MDSKTLRHWAEKVNKVYVIIYHDPYEHSECNEGCCGVQTSTIVDIATTKELADIIVSEHLKHHYNRKNDYDIEEFILHSPESFIIDKL
jgi:hypothetical protein